MAFCYFLFFFLFYEVITLRVINLSSSKWTVVNSNKSIEILGQVPGGIYSDLRRSGVLDQDILYRFNDVLYRWVGRDNWTYSSRFTVDDDLMRHKHVYLVFHGIDTVSRIFLNDHLIATTDNMFIKYKFDVKNMLQSLNSLEVEVISGVNEAWWRAGRVNYVVPLNCWPDVYHGECHINHLRKAQFSFGWDWAPAIPSLGIWKDVELEGANSAKLQDVTVVQKKMSRGWRVMVRALFDMSSEPTSPGILRAVLHLGQGKVVDAEENIMPAISKHQLEARTSLFVPDDDVDLWWPNGYGRQNLYNLDVSFSNGREVSTKNIRIGFREVYLNQSFISDDRNQGRNFFFSINGVPIFAKGSNWIPTDVLPELSVEPTRVRRLLQAAKEAHFNMLRVWGGGYYETNFFYSICDELGIMVWQDLMFACHMYPAYQDFLNNVSLEVIQQVNRLQHHPSIVVWAGNNENEAALSGNWYNTAKNFKQYKDDFVKLYVDTIKPIINFVDPTRPYVVSSPSNGLESEEEGYIAKHPQDSRYGDVHYYNYLSNGWDWMIYPKTRFASEYGTQSLPSLSSLKAVSDPGQDLVLGSTFLTWRQHLPAGDAYMKDLIASNLPMATNLSDYIYLSQINQAMSMKVETETYRRDRGILYSTGEGYTMGALYWQLNDVWQAPSWSSIDYSGKWKMLHYYAKKFFAPVIVSPKITIDQQLSVWIISDLLEDIESVSLLVKVYEYNISLTPSKSYKFNTKIVKSNGTEAVRLPLRSIIKPYNPRDFFIVFSLEDSSHEKLAPVNFLFPSRLSTANFSNPNIKVRVARQISNFEIELELSSEKVALFVWLDYPELSGHFSDNGFHMTESTMRVNFTSYERISVDDICNLQVTSLKTHYN